MGIRRTGPFFFLNLRIKACLSIISSIWQLYVLQLPCLKLNQVTQFRKGLQDQEPHECPPPA